MPTLDEDGWELESGVDRHAEAPETFELPDDQIRANLVAECRAKLLFALRGRDGRSVERMWVRITGRTETGYLGVLLNDPATPGAPIRLGDQVEFGPVHIIDALPPEDWDPGRPETEG